MVGRKYANLFRAALITLALICSSPIAGYSQTIYYSSDEGDYYYSCDPDDPDYYPPACNQEYYDGYYGYVGVPIIVNGDFDEEHHHYYGGYHGGYRGYGGYAGHGGFVGGHRGGFVGGHGGFGGHGGMRR